MTQRAPRRAATRPRYGRIATLGASATVTLVAMLASLGILAPSPAAVVPVARTASYSTGTSSTPDPGPSSSTPVGAHPSTVSADPNAAAADTPAPTGMHTAHLQDQTALPASSGSGRRIVFSQRLQRVWLVVDSHHEGDGVKQTYLVSGSLTHNLTPGTYTVYSRSRHARGVDDSGVMQYFVRFTQGPTGAAIGFHSIPTKHGTPLQAVGQLGTPQSHGCIRQALSDAVALWHFAPIGTKVVVVP
jgi:hypothetical protein